MLLPQGIMAGPGHQDGAEAHILALISRERGRWSSLPLGEEGCNWEVAPQQWQQWREVTRILSDGFGTNA